MNPEKKIAFSDEGVSITIPAHEKNIGVRKLPLGSLDSMKPVQGGFRPARLVINFELYDENHPETFLKEIDPPIEVRIRYTKGDLQRAERVGEPLALGFWDGEKWVQFTKEKHNFALEPNAKPETGGEGVVQISRWSDPPIGWAP